VAPVDLRLLVGEGFFADALAGRGDLSAVPNPQNAHNHLSDRMAHPFIVFRLSTNDE
jgi:hypothetical protein